MYDNHLSINRLYPPFVSGGLWQRRCLSLSAGICRHPPKSLGGVKYFIVKELSNIRHFRAERKGTSVICGGSRKRIYGLEKKFCKNLKNLLTNIRYTVYTQYMTMIRKAIIKRMNELKLNPNQLSEMLKDSIPRQTIYDFLSGKTDARTEVASALIKALGLELKPEKTKKKKR